MTFRQKTYVFLKEYFIITMGSFIAAAAMNVFLIPHKIVPGGVSGAATVIYYLSGGVFPVGATMLAINIPLFLAGITFIGRKFFIRTLYSTVVLSVSIDYTKPFMNYFIQNYLLKIESVPSQPDLLLYSIFGGLIMGLGLGLVFKFESTTGGSDLAARIINHFIPALTLGQALLIVDISVVLMAAVSFESFLLALYAVVTLLVTSKVIDAMLEGVSFAKAVFIISNNPGEISKKILNNLDRGVTSLKGTGMYTGNDKQVLLCILHRRQIPALKKLVETIDEKAFIVLTDVREVLGEGFTKYK